MALTHPTSIRNGFAENIRTAANAGAGNPVLVIGTSSLSLPSTGVLVSINLGADYGAASSGTTTVASNGQSGTAGAGGTAAIGIVTDSDGNEVYRGTCGVGTGDFQLNTTTISASDLVTMTANASWTAPP